MLGSFDRHPTLYVILGIAVAIILYLCRSRRQTLYGFIEIATGVWLMILSIKVTEGSFSRDFSSDFDTVRSTVSTTTYLGAIFVMVRGFDNIKHGWSSFKFPFLKQPLRPPIKDE